MEKKLIFDLSYSELVKFLEDIGESPYRADQIWKGLYQQFWCIPDQFTTLPKSLRKDLNDLLCFTSIEPYITLISSDKKTTKVLFHLLDQNPIEAVLMKYDQRNTICISTQSGCAMSCIFCATGQMGFKRNLTRTEIIEQVLFFLRLLNNAGEKLTNIVIMGMGEPFHNYEPTMKAIDFLKDPQNLNMGERRFTVSTSGIIPMIYQFSEEKRQVNLAISLHAANDELRNSLMPVNRKYPLRPLIESCHYYVQKTGRRITFEWALIKGINDSNSNAKELTTLLRGLNCHVNLIPLNQTNGYTGQPTSREKVEAFKNVLESFGIPCSVRLRRGIDIRAGCGQLAANLS